MNNGTPNLRKPYAKGSYNKFNDTEQWIRLSDGCPNNCQYCRETIENGADPIYYATPRIIRNKVKILDMNLIYKPRALELINSLGNAKVNNKVVYYELICGIDFRYLTQEIANALKNNRFKNIRLAWDYGFLAQQKKMKKAINILLKASYKPRDITIFMICNWKTPYRDNCRKLDLCKVWNVKVADCYFDNQISPNIKAIFWTPEHIKKFRASVRKHNQLVNFKIDPEVFT